MKLFNRIIILIIAGILLIPAVLHSNNLSDEFLSFYKIPRIFMNEETKKEYQTLFNFFVNDKEVSDRFISFISRLPWPDPDKIEFVELTNFDGDTFSCFIYENDKEYIALKPDLNEISIKKSIIKESKKSDFINFFKISMNNEYYKNTYLNNSLEYFLKIEKYNSFYSEGNIQHLFASFFLIQNNFKGDALLYLYKYKGSINYHLKEMFDNFIYTIMKDDLKNHNDTYTFKYILKKWKSMNHLYDDNNFKNEINEFISVLEKQIMNIDSKVSGSSTDNNTKNSFFKICSLYRNNIYSPKREKLLSIIENSTEFDSLISSHEESLKFLINELSNNMILPVMFKKKNRNKKSLFILRVKDISLLIIEYMTKRRFYNQKKRFNLFSCESKEKQKEIIDHIKSTLYENNLNSLKKDIKFIFESKDTQNLIRNLDEYELIAPGAFDSICLLKQLAQLSDDDSFLLYADALARRNNYDLIKRLKEVTDIKSRLKRNTRSNYFSSSLIFLLKHGIESDWECFFHNFRNVSTEKKFTSYFCLYFSKIDFSKGKVSRRVKRDIKKSFIEESKIVYPPELILFLTRQLNKRKNNIMFPEHGNIKFKSIAENSFSILCKLLKLNNKFEELEPQSERFRIIDKWYDKWLKNERNMFLKEFNMEDYSLISDNIKTSLNENELFLEKLTSEKMTMRRKKFNKEIMTKACSMLVDKDNSDKKTLINSLEYIITYAKTTEIEFLTSIIKTEINSIENKSPDFKITRLIHDFKCGCIRDKSFVPILKMFSDLKIKIKSKQYNNFQLNLPYPLFQNSYENIVKRIFYLSKYPKRFKYTKDYDYRKEYDEWLNWWKIMNSENKEEIESLKRKFREERKRLRDIDIKKSLKRRKNRITREKNVEIQKQIKSLKFINIGSAFFHAVKNNNLEIVRYLIQNNQVSNICDEDGNSPLHLAVKNKKKNQEKNYEREKSILELLIENKSCDTKIKNKQGDTALLFFIKNYYRAMETLDILLKRKDHINIKDESGKNALELSLENDKVFYISKLINAGAVYDNLNETSSVVLLRWACGNRRIDIVRKLVKNKNYINRISLFQDYETPLLAAVENNDYDITELLLKNGADVNYYSKCGPSFFKIDYKDTILNTAIRNNNLKIVKLLLDCGADPLRHNRMFSPLPFLLNTKSEIIELLFDYIPEFDIRSFSKNDKLKKEKLFILECMKEMEKDEK